MYCRVSLRTAHAKNRKLKLKKTHNEAATASLTTSTGKKYIEKCLKNQTKAHEKIRTYSYSVQQEIVDEAFYLLSVEK